MIQQLTKYANPYIAQIRQQLATCSDLKVDWLVIAHRDERMLVQLGEAFPNNALAVIALPQECWAMDDESVEEVVKWALDELQVQGIVLVGHSQGGTPMGQVQLLGGKVKSQTDAEVESLSAPNSLIERVRQAQSLVEGCETHFQDQLEKLSLHSPVEQRLMRNQIRLQGLFYRAESGVFCLYHRRTGTFQALVN